MKRQVKTFIAILLAALFIFTAVGCGNTGDPEATSGAETSVGQVSSPVEDTTGTPGTTKAPETTNAPDTTKTPDTTKAPETTAAPDTTTAPETTAEPETGAKLVAFSFDSINTNGNRLNQPDGNAGSWMDKNLTDRTIEDSYGSVGAITFRGWAGYDQAIDAFGYIIDDGEPVFSKDFVMNDAADIAAVRNAGGEYAERFVITVPTQGLTGKHSIKGAVLFKDGSYKAVKSAKDSLYVVYSGADSASPSPSASSDSIIKVLQYNIKNSSDVSDAKRAEMLRAFIDEMQPDSVGLEEATPSWMPELIKTGFPSNYAYINMERDSGGESNPLFYRSDKYELVASGWFWLSDTPDVSSKFSGSNCTRIAVWARLKNKTTGFEYIHINTHLDHNGNNSSSVGMSIREKQIKVIFEFMAKQGDIPFVLTGDFNQVATNSSGTVALYSQVTGKTAVKLADGSSWTSPLADLRVTAAATVPSDRTATMTKYYDTASSSFKPSYLPIDYIFYSSKAFTGSSYWTYIVSGIYGAISDHLAVYGELVIK